MRIRRPKHTVEQVAKVFKSAGCKLLTKVYLSSKQQLKYQCKCGMIQFTCYNNFVRGHRCMRCYLKQFEGSEQKNRLRLRAALFTINDVAKILGVEYSALWQAIRVAKILPAPVHSAGLVRKYYSKKDVDKILSMVELWPCGEVDITSRS